MALNKKSSGEDDFTADIRSEVQREVRRESKRNRKPIVIGTAIAGGIVALGAAFGVGLIAGHAAPGFPGGGDFAAGQGPQQGGHGFDRDGDHGGQRPGDGDGDRGGQQGQGLQAPGPNGQSAPNGTVPAPNGTAPAPGGSTTTP